VQQHDLIAKDVPEAGGQLRGQADLRGQDQGRLIGLERAQSQLNVYARFTAAGDAV
jgi:hypothetical protein